jgi:DmsE family decaheme c-type cytochrome
VAALFCATAFVGTAQLSSAQVTPPAEAKPNQAEAPGQPKEQEAKAPAKAEYVTSLVCQGCHEDIYNAFFKRNPHRTLETNKKKGWEEKACESCHGPGSVHAESASATDILNPLKVRPSSADRVCLTCHLNQQTQVGRVMSGHARSQVRCAECHSIHAAEPSQSVYTDARLLPGSISAMPNRRVTAQTANCTRCHSNTWGEFQRPYRHNLPEGSMTCTDCHNPHGGTRRSMWVNAGMNEPGCFRCHGDKRGPFTFEHAPVRLEGCSTCHQPHGSANPRMLTRHEVRFQCLECHSNTSAATLATTNVQQPAGGLGVVPPAFHDLRSPRYRNCTTCHWKIHGSQVNRAFTR